MNNPALLKFTSVLMGFLALIGCSSNPEAHMISNEFPGSEIHARDTLLVVYREENQIVIIENEESFGLDFHHLIGTAFIPTMDYYLLPFDCGLRPKNVRVGVCDQSDISFAYSGESEINAVEIEEDLLIVETKVSANCCSDFLWQVTVRKDHTLNIDYIEYGGQCACDCCFGLTLSFVIEDKFLFEKFVKQLTLNKNPETLTAIPNK